MKKYLFLAFLFILIFPISAAFADDVQTGNVGPDNSGVSAAANSSFTVFGSILGL